MSICDYAGHECKLKAHGNCSTCFVKIEHEEEELENENAWKRLNYVRTEDLI